MTNDVLNEIIFRDVNRATQDRILEKTCDAHEQGCVNFEILLPSLSFWEGGGDNDVRARVPGWGDWASYNWGTVRHPYNDRPIERSDDTLILRFETAWRPPYGWIVALFNFFKLPFEHNSIIQFGGRGRCGKFTCEPEPKWVELDATDTMHAHLLLLFYGSENQALPPQDVVDDLQKDEQLWLNG
jgi:hypothetical protein